MAKKKIDDPLFLTFVNSPIGEMPSEFIRRGVGDPSKIGELDQIDHKKVQREQKKRVINISEQILKKNILSSDYARRLKKNLKDFDKRGDQYMKQLFSAWFDIRGVIDALIEYPARSSNKMVDWLEKDYGLIRFVMPTFHMKDAKKFEIKLTPALPFEAAVLVAPVFTDFAQFLLNQYKPGIFAYCKLDSCGKVFIKNDARKEYCCKKHTDKASELRTMKNKDNLERFQIRDKLRKRFSRHPHKDTMDREAFIKKNWPKDKLHLYRPPQR